ncbi:MAG: hypothetical protein GC154_06325 [bacterium]|nr:hypothetical protein [bacterium]
MPENKLHVCLNKETREVFFASMVDRKDLHADLRTSYNIDKGMTLLIMPIAEDWKGGTIAADAIVNSTKSIEAHVIRTEGRGAFRVRMLTGDQKDIAERVRSGGLRGNRLAVDVQEVGAIFEIRLSGRIGVDSVGKIQRAVKGLPANTKPILFDMTEVVYLGKDSFGVFSELIDELREKGHPMSILVEPESRSQELVSSSRLAGLVDVFDDREKAVTTLLLRTFT